jgi:hypothetical protein
MSIEAPRFPLALFPARCPLITTTKYGCRVQTNDDDTSNSWVTYSVNRLVRESHTLHEGISTPREKAHLAPPRSAFAFWAALPPPPSSFIPFSYRMNLSISFLLWVIYCLWNDGATRSQMVVVSLWPRGHLSVFFCRSRHQNKITAATIISRILLYCTYIATNKQLLCAAQKNAIIAITEPYLMYGPPPPLMVRWMRVDLYT